MSTIQREKGAFNTFKKREKIPVTTSYPTMFAALFETSPTTFTAMFHLSAANVCIWTSH